MLSNIYLHEVLDKWFSEQVKPRLKAKAALVRFADDAVMIFSQESDARRAMEVLPKRLGRYGLTVHPEKTRLIRFIHPKALKGGLRTERQWEAFDFLGFTHYWGLSSKGNWVVKRKTQKARFGRALKAAATWCKWNRHLPLQEQQKTLTLKLRGHFNYYGIVGNYNALNSFSYQVCRAWHKWLNRRTRGNPMSWAIFNKLLARYPLPAPQVRHSHHVAKL